MPLTALIVDDEELARENLSMLLEEFCPEIKVVGKASGVDDARKKIEELKPQVVFLDIRMPSGTEGFDLLDSLQEKKFVVVFVTAFKDYAIRAFNANAIHYILKPIDIDDLKAAVEKIVASSKEFTAKPDTYNEYISTLKDLSENLTKNKYTSRITIHHAKGIKIFNDDQIAYIEADGNCSRLHFTDHTKYLDTRTLAVYEDLLNPQKFFRVHKSYIINLEHLSEYLSEDGYFALLSTGDKVPISRNRQPDFVKKIKSL